MPPVRIPHPPAVEARPADPEGQGRGDALRHARSGRTGSGSAARSGPPPIWSRWSSAAGRQEQEARSLLVGVTEESPMRIGSRCSGWGGPSRHASQLADPMSH